MSAPCLVASTALPPSLIMAAWAGALPLVALVRVEAAPALAAEEAGVPHRDEARWRRHARLAQLLVKRLGRVHVDIDADQVDERARPHRPAGAVLHAGIEILRAHARLVEHADAVVQERD